MKRLAFAWLLAAALAAPTVPLRAQTVVHDDRGVALAFASPPRRIVSLLPSLTEAVCALQACARLVGVDRFSDWPASVAALPRLGGIDDTAVERLVALRPDLVLAARSARAVPRLESLGLKVMVLDSDTHADVRRTLDRLGHVLGEPGSGPTSGPGLWAGIERQVAQAAARVPAAWRGRRVYFEVGPEPYAAGAASFIGQTLAALGLRNIVPASMGPFPHLNPEFVVRAQPDIVMAAAADLAAMPSRPGWAALKALHGQACGFNDAQYELLIRPGPRLGEAADLLADCLAGLARRAP
jgi:iron complex transport system substrate-binding protein